MTECPPVALRVWAVQLPAGFPAHRCYFLPRSILHLKGFPLSLPSCELVCLPTSRKPTPASKVPSGPPSVAKRHSVCWQPKRTSKWSVVCLRGETEFELLVESCFKRIKQIRCVNNKSEIIKPPSGWYLAQKGVSSDWQLEAPSSFLLAFLLQYKPGYK